MKENLTNLTSINLVGLRAAEKLRSQAAAIWLILKKERKSVLTVEEIIDGFRDGAVKKEGYDTYANLLFQEAIRIGMELNNQYHTPEELREIMGRLTGKKIDDTFRLFPPFHTDFGKNITIGSDVFINSGCHFQDQGGIVIGDGSLIGYNVVLATINHDLDPRNNRKIIIILS